ncbi:hypothetical protein A3752_19875 [Oleiphilus sp. HI0081]|nr:MULTISPECIES: hypothetical protein [unclassified Oleiphilus]KZY84998.1 hypothetical protein A3743_20085 [Oleiphilus sp. HI0072]KZZ20021.1 hypothetical protein A3749_19875 [Oleiphilus sp. HI0078]KZZ29104.1 hypothetical protein A3752_19875 [Oleiphilus sp. HI0081]KZY31096.1 hypothetical protein A3729_09565 [Oleiphilus sp. HI0043]KZZ69052.1 hypothetical protein A3763_13125 [Oleiphilus sp. HI0128]
MYKGVLIVFLLLLSGASQACEEFRKPKAHFPVLGVTPEFLSQEMPKIISLLEGQTIVYMSFWSPKCLDVMAGKLESRENQEGFTYYFDKNDKGWFISGAHKWGS